MSRLQHLKDDLDCVLENFAEWKSIPCNKYGNTDCADVERERFNQIINRLRTDIAAIDSCIECGSPLPLHNQGCSQSMTHHTTAKAKS